MHTHKFTNRLIHETSPYLLQHAHNPVDWYPWGGEALQRAAAEDKPMLVSIGYSACHWCHVMERESFEDEATAEIMNKYFVNIKIDREERPDLDHIYMDAVQAMTGSGGWPLNVFLMPDARPFYGGTYFPPVRAYNRMSWQETLQSVYEIFTDRRHEAELQANNLTQHIASANSFGMAGPDDFFFNKAGLQTMAENLLAAADKQWGGFGRAPKFPQTFSIQYLLRHYHFTKDEGSLNQALLSLDKMIQGGIYDHLGGGFARYSTDEKWLAPHFEKMVYDNALLISVLAEAYQLTKQAKYKSCIEETVTFIERELMHEGGGFYSALDADSEGVEGKFYTWSKEEIDEILGDDADIFCRVYNVSERGNWEHTNILWLPADLTSLAKNLQIEESSLEQKLAKCRNKLLEQRSKRIRPQLDDKVLLGWNGLMISALCKAAAATGEQKFRLMAERSIKFAEQNFSTPEGLWLHTWKNGEAKYMAFLDDLAALVQAYLQLAVITGSERYLRSARALTINIIDDFSDDAGVFFLFTSRLQDDVIVRKKEVYDGATPSGNALMAENLFQLSVYFDISVWKDRAIRMVASLKSAVSRYPSSFGVWAMCVQTVVYGMNEIVVVGENAFDMLSSINQLFIPNKLLMATTLDGDENYPLLRSKSAKEGEIQLYLCKDFMCKQPVKTVAELIFLLNQQVMQ